MTRVGVGPPRGRPVVIEFAAAALVAGGLFGLTQLAFGGFVVTGSLPAKGPILAVAFILYGASVALGLLARSGRAWLPTTNLTALFAILHLVAWETPPNLIVGLANALVLAILLRQRRWFAGMASRHGYRRGISDPS